MKRKFAMLAGIVCVLAIGFVIFFLLYNGGALVFDRSAKVFAEGLEWKGTSYSMIYGGYTEGKTIAKSEDGNWEIKEIKEDPSHTFVVARSFFDQFLYVADDYTIPTSGEITGVCWDGYTVKNKEVVEAIAQMDLAKTTSFVYETEAIFVLDDTQRMKALYVAYEGCPVATVSKGWLGKIDGNWVITTDVFSDSYEENGAPKPYTVGCYCIPNEYSQILENYCSKFI